MKERTNTAVAMHQQSTWIKWEHVTEQSLSWKHVWVEQPEKPQVFTTTILANPTVSHGAKKHLYTPPVFQGKDTGRYSKRLLLNIGELENIIPKAVNKDI